MPKYELLVSRRYTALVLVEADNEAAARDHFLEGEWRTEDEANRECHDTHIVDVTELDETDAPLGPEVPTPRYRLIDDQTGDIIETLDDKQLKLWREARTLLWALKDAHQMLTDLPNMRVPRTGSTTRLVATWYDSIIRDAEIGGAA
jgi:hypothetical protein